MTAHTTETVAAVRNRQVMWLPWMQEATAGMADTDLVDVVTERTPFGSYLLHINPASNQGGR